MTSSQISRGLMVVETKANTGSFIWMDVTCYDSNFTTSNFTSILNFKTLLKFKVVRCGAPNSRNVCDYTVTVHY